MAKKHKSKLPVGWIVLNIKYHHSTLVAVDAMKLGDVCQRNGVVSINMFGVDVEVDHTWSELLIMIKEAQKEKRKWLASK